MRKVRVLAALLFVLVVTSVSFATPQCDTIHTYYSDNTYTVVVGHKYEMCSGTWWDGQRTAYSTTYVDCTYPCS